MPLGIGNSTNTSMEFIEGLTNVTSYSELAINVNTDIYGGYLFFILLFILWVILFITAYYNDKDILKNLMYSGAVVSVVSLFLRAVYVDNNGWRGLLTDSQLWVFPILTIILAMILWMNRE